MVQNRKVTEGEEDSHTKEHTWPANVIFLCVNALESYDWLQLPTYNLYILLSIYHIVLINIFSLQNNSMVELKDWEGPDDQLFQAPLLRKYTVL